MSGSARKTSYNEEYATFFEGELVGEADIVYRFAYACTLDEKASFECVQKVYKNMVKDLPSLVEKSSNEMRRRLLEESYEILKSEKEKGSGKNKLDNFLKGLDKRERICLIMVEIGGIYPSECSDMLELEEIEVRKALASARAKLVNFGN